ncbi:hypothetical protein [Arsenophonus nasoniae]|uniref:hypothetical protein n=1 Tax=Arsenophonus nasoniae TaxID=638 RepID=UPI003879F8F2
MHKSGHGSVSYLVGQQEVTPCHRSLTARCHEAIDHLRSSGTWNTGAMYGEDMPRKPL